MITTFSIVSGMIGTEISTKLVIIVGLINICSDGFAMSVASFIGTKSENEIYKYYEKMEQNHIDSFVLGEIREIRQIFINKGFKGEALRSILRHIIKHRDLWIAIMINEEYKVSDTYGSPLMSSIYTFISFMIAGMIPLIPFMLHIANPFLFSSICTVVGFFTIGYLRGNWTIRANWISGVEAILVGGFAAIISYFVGYIFHCIYNVNTVV